MARPLKRKRAIGGPLAIAGDAKRRPLSNQTERDKNMKTEGVVFTPVPVERNIPETPKVKLRLSREACEPVCELCGHTVIATHCKRICLHCGFMTGCSEGI